MQNNTSRIQYLDIAKGIGIILVVLGHSNAPLTNIINQFHMPFFAAISGLLYSERKNIKDYIKSKFIALYIPFLFWNLLFYYSFDLWTYNDLSLHSIIIRPLAIVLTLTKSKYLGGATWFLASLFWISCCYRMLVYCLNKLFPKHTYAVILFISIACGVIGSSINLPFFISRTLVLSMFYAIAVFVQRNVKIQFNWLTAFVSLVISSLCMFNNYVNMGDNEYKSFLLFVIASVGMTYFILWFSTFLANKTKLLNIVLAYLGRHSFDILLWHFLVFRIIIIVQMDLIGRYISFADCLNYYPIYSSDNGWWLIYSVLGIIVSLLIGRLLNKTKLKVFLGNASK